MQATCSSDGRSTTTGGREKVGRGESFTFPSPHLDLHCPLSLKLLFNSKTLFQDFISHVATIVMHSVKLTTLLLNPVGNAHNFSQKQHWSLVMVFSVHSLTIAEDLVIKVVIV